MENKGLDRRRFIKNSLLATSLLAAPHISRLSAKELAKDKVRVAYIGVGGHGANAAQGNQSEQTVAFCDVDDKQAARTFAALPDVPRFRDFRKMFDQLGSQIDAVSIATPDHTHFPIAMEAMQRGYHIYLEKPMAHTIEQVRTLRQAAQYYQRVTQLGIHGHSMAGLRVLKEWLDAGVIGDVLDVHLWTDRPRSRDFHAFEADAPEEPIPSTLAWDLWLGPARYRPYNGVYLPSSWRGWWDFGNGPLGDIGAHMWDVIEYCLEIGLPKTVSARNPRPSTIGTPRWSGVDYFYEARAGRPPVSVHWYNGVRDGQPNLPASLPYWPAGQTPKIDAGIYIVGQRGAIYYPAMRAEVSPTVYPDSLWQEIKPSLPQRSIPRIRGGHHMEFFNAIREGRQANANFDYGAPLSEGVLIGNLALKTGKTIHWDAANMRAIGVPEADPFIHSPEPREGWRYTLPSA